MCTSTLTVHLSRIHKLNKQNTPGCLTTKHSMDKPCNDLAGKQCLLK